MKKYSEMSIEELKEEEKLLFEKYEAYKSEGLKLDLSRGKPCKEQLDLSNELFKAFSELTDFDSESGIDIRNYGGLDGIPEAKKMMADLMDTEPEHVIVYGESSLNIMYDLVSKAWTHGIMGNTPWSKLPSVKFLCPVPGYDRHFAITGYFGIEMINIPMNGCGPDMDMVEEYVKNDDSVKGIWCVPKYSNPGGVVYSDEVIMRFARLRPAAPDFRIFWDNAYNVHYLDLEHKDEIPDLLSLSKEVGNPDHVYKFGSFSKITFPGASVSGLATSDANVKDVLSQLKYQTIGHNKVNQLLHARYFGGKEGVLRHMAKHAAILKPKFDAIRDILGEELSGLGIAEWTNPNGGYFVGFDTLPGLAKKTVAMMKDAGVKMTGAGATYPYGKDPEDRNIRIAPTFATLEEVEKAIRIFATVVRLVSVQKLLGE